MTLERDVVTSELFGLEGTFPCPGWVVLDAARGHGFTGELTFDSIPSAKVYLDSGEIYLAERVTDPPLGSRLVDAGALNTAQLEHGLMIIGEVAHLGRLFERVPSANRDSVLLVTEMMTEECVRWLAGQLVRDVVAAPYRHHPAGIQRWLQPVPATGAQLPTSTAHETPIELVDSEPTLMSVEPLDDSMIQWDHPSWLDDRSSNGLASPDQHESPATASVGAWPVTESVLPVDESIGLIDFTASAVGPEAEPAAPAAQRGRDAAWLTTPPSIADLAPGPEQPQSVATGAPVPIIAAPAPAAALAVGTESDVAWPDPVVVNDDPALLATVIAEPAIGVQAESSDADAVAAIVTDPVGVQDHSHDEQSFADLPPVDGLGPEPAILPVRQVKGRAGSAQERPDVVVEFDEWVDRLETDGLPDAGTDLTGATKRVPVPPAPLDRFEVIWPSGEIDEQLDGDGVAVPAAGQSDLDEIVVPTPVSETGDEVTDEVVLAVRRAVATIETGSLTARRRLVTSPKVEDPSRGTDDSSERVLTPLRHDRPEVHDGPSPVPGAARHRAPTRSVFDDDMPAVTPAEIDPPSIVDPASGTEGATRTGALRRLIGSLRRR